MATKNEPYNRLKKYGVRTQNTYVFDITKRGHKNTQESLTTPGETLTIKELFTRAALQGHFPIAERQAAFLDAELEEINGMYKQGLDFTDIDAVKSQLKEIEQRVEDYNRNKARAEHEQETNNKIKKALEKEKELRKEANTIPDKDKKS